MTGYTVHTGSTEKFSQSWDRIFEKEKAATKSHKKKAAAKTAKKKEKKSKK